MREEEAERFEAYCRDRGFKKSTLIARLIREFLDKEQFPAARNGSRATARNEHRTR